jgi:phosphate transport system protein
MGPTRQSFARRLTELEERALGALDLVQAAISGVDEAVQRQDASLAAKVIDGDDELDRRYLEVKHGLLMFMATQAPVATDLRLAAALLTVIGHVERMGDQCVNIAKRVPFGGSPPEGSQAMLEGLREMAAMARALAQEAKVAFTSRDVALAEAIVTTDDGLDALNRRAFDLAAAAGGGPAQHEWAMQMMLTARWFERIGDHAVDIGEEAAFVVTGDFREFSDASHPGGVRLAAS